MGDSGYYNRWTLEIENHALVPLVLKVGQRVGQIVFFRTGDVSASYSMNGQYQKTDVLEELIRDWSPLSMVPSKAVAFLRALEASGGPTPRASFSLEARKVQVHKRDQLKYLNVGRLNVRK